MKKIGLGTLLVFLNCALNDPKIDRVSLDRIAKAIAKILDQHAEFDIDDSLVDELMRRYIKIHE